MAKGKDRLFDIMNVGPRLYHAIEKSGLPFVEDWSGTFVGPDLIVEVPDDRFLEFLNLMADADRYFNLEDHPFRLLIAKGPKYGMQAKVAMPDSILKRYITYHTRKVENVVVTVDGEVWFERTTTVTVKEEWRNSNDN